jgi:CBS domain-containing protein
VVDEAGSLQGLVTLTDILRAQADSRPAEAPVEEVMTRRPATLVASDTALIAASAFREHGFKILPVIDDCTSRRLVGQVRARKLIARLLETIPPP